MAPYNGEEYSPINIGEVESKGIEVRANADISIASRTSLHIEESYIWLDANNITPGDELRGMKYHILLRMPAPLFIAGIDSQRLGIVWGA